MGLLDLVKRMRGENGLQKLAEQTAELCIDEVWQRVAGRIMNMRVLEARGYIRARGIRVIRAAVERQISAQPALIRMQRSRLINQSVEVVIGLVLHSTFRTAFIASCFIIPPSSLLLARTTSS